MKDAANHQLEFAEEAASTFANNIKSVMLNRTKEAGRFASSLKEMFDMESFLKYARKATFAREESLENTNIIHGPIDWSKYPPSALPNASNAPDFTPDLGSTYEESDEEEMFGCDQQTDIAHVCQKAQDAATTCKFSKTQMHKRRQRKKQLSYVHEKTALYQNASEYNPIVNLLQSKFNPDNPFIPHRKKLASDSLDSNTIVDIVKSKLILHDSQGQHKKKEKPFLSIDPMTGSLIFTPPYAIQKDRERRSSVSRSQKVRFHDNLVTSENSPGKYNKRRRCSTSIVDFTSIGRGMQPVDPHQQYMKQRNRSNSVIDFSRLAGNLPSTSTRSETVKRGSRKAYYKK